MCRGASRRRGVVVADRVLGCEQKARCRGGWTRQCTCSRPALLFSAATSSLQTMTVSSYLASCKSFNSSGVRPGLACLSIINNLLQRTSSLILMPALEMVTARSSIANGPYFKLRCGWILSLLACSFSPWHITCSFSKFVSPNKWLALFVPPLTCNWPCRRFCIHTMSVPFPMVLSLNICNRFYCDSWLLIIVTVCICINYVIKKTFGIIF